jgi:hypothetical protein
MPSGGSHMVYKHLQAAQTTEHLEVSIVIKDHRIPCIEEVKNSLLTVLTTDIY